MSETVEDDENMIVLVVEDKEHTKGDSKNLVPITIKVEPLHDSAQDKTGNEVFDYPTYTDEIVKEEYEAEYLEDNFIEEDGEDKEQYDIEFLEETPLDLLIKNEEHNNSDQNYSDHDYDDHAYSDQEYTDYDTKKLDKREKRKKRLKKKLPQVKHPVKKHKCVSLVKQLRDDNPEMAEDDKLLVQHLANIMRQMRPPKPPNNYCKVITVGEITTYECTFCGVQRDTVPLAARHYQFKHGELYLTCFACGVNYRNTTNLYKHEKRCSAADAAVVLRARGLYLGRKGRGRPYTTTNKFVTCNTLRAQMKQKTRLYCSKCPASFVHRDNLVAHENSHEGIRPFRCHHCTMAYTSYPALKRHLKLHGEFQYACAHCSAKFKLKPALVSHLDTHRPVRKYPCLYCERRFAQKTALRHHMNKVHLNLPPEHGCPVCPKRYARLTHVKEHMDSAHGLVMITRKMFFQALPSMTDSEVLHARKFFNFEMSQIKETKEVEYALPADENTLEKTEDSPELQKYVKIIKKKSEVDISSVPDEIQSDNDIATYIEIGVNQDVDSTFQEEPRNTEHSSPSRHKKKIITESQMQVDDNTEDDQCNIQYIRPKNIPYPDTNAADKKMYRHNVRNTVNKNRVNFKTKKKKHTQSLYELKHTFINHSKGEIEAIDPKETSENISEIRKEPPNLELAPETDVSSNFEDNTKENIYGDAMGDEANGSEEASENNMLIAEFLEYLKSGVVPRHVKILRRGR